MEDFVQCNTMFNTDNNKIGTSRRHLCSTLKDHVNCYTFEISFYGYKMKESDVIIPYTEESCILQCDLTLSLNNSIDHLPFPVGSSFSLLP